MKIEELHQLYLKSSGVSTDTRKINEGSIFFALKGDNFNANEFAEQALEKGANHVVIDDEKYYKAEGFILVDNVLQTLQDLARFHRIQLGIPILALTGSNGKTTTKELMNAVLSKKFKTTATFGNLNNHIGVPLTLLSMTKETEMGIVEMGANHLQEIAFLSQIAKPDYGYITNFGKAHLEGFGSVEGVIKGKSELYDYLKSQEKLLFLNIDDPIQQKQMSYGETFSFGNSEPADVRIEYEYEKTAGIVVNGQKINSKLTGSYNAINMAAAYTVGAYFKIDHEAIKDALENYIPGNNRSQVIIKDSLEIILDAYNANPTSMEAAIKNLEGFKGKPKVAILGDMFEMGRMAEAEHQYLSERLRKGTIDRVFLIGENFFRTNTTENIQKYRTFEDFAAAFNPEELNDSVVLIKGSRGMALERVLEFL